MGVQSDIDVLIYLLVRYVPRDHFNQQQQNNDTFLDQLLLCTMQYR